MKESTKREASTRPDDVDSRPGAAAREASGDDLHSALGRSSAKDAVAFDGLQGDGKEAGRGRDQVAVGGASARWRVTSWCCRRVRW